MRKGWTGIGNDPSSGHVPPFGIVWYQTLTMMQLSPGQMDDQIMDTLKLVHWQDETLRGLVFVNMNFVLDFSTLVPFLIYIFVGQIN